MFKEESHQDTASKTSKAESHVSRPLEGDVMRWVAAKEEGPVFDKQICYPIRRWERR